ncbi:MAG: hypothetical protein MJE66_03995 [Proteobacteria bacterium]|nr:hypothetical protein [Pseudomonadota bacterium]
MAVPPSAAAPLAGDFDGNGAVDASDETWLRAVYGARRSEPASPYDPAADLDANDVIDYRDAALYGAAFGSVGGDVDVSPPAVFVTLNDIPDDMNDLLVVPPDGFRITLHLDAAGGSVLDPATLTVTCSQAVGPYPPGAELGSQFSVTPTRAVWEVPTGSDLARTTHEITVWVQDAAGNDATETFGFAVRDFAFGPPLENLNTFFLDFDQDRSLSPEIDFIEDLREYGLSSAATPALETQMRDRLVAEIVARVYPFFDRGPDGSPGVDPVHVAFSAALPAGAHSRVCVGGQSSLGPSFLGATTLDPNNANETTDECASSGNGIFPQALDNLWSGNPEFQAAFSPLDPGLGGTPVGEHPDDAAVMAPNFDPATASAAELARHLEIENAVDAFAQAIAGVTAHEVGHALGLVAHGDAPGGLFGGLSGGRRDHNVTAGADATPAENFLMNAGGSFTFQELTGRGGESLPVFRPLNWAYLRNRVALNVQVTGLFPPPVVDAVEPNPVVFPDPFTGVPVTIRGADFLNDPVPPTVSLVIEGDPTPNPIQNVTWVDAETLVGTVQPALVAPGLYDLRFVNSDGQRIERVDFVEVAGP